MKKILFILAFIPIITFGQGTQNLTVKRIKTDSLYIHKLASVSSSNIVLVLDSLTGKIGKRPYPSGGGDSYWQELTGNLANIDTTTGFYVNSTSGVKNTNLSMYPASSWWRIEQSNRTTGVQSVAQGSAGVVSLQANAGGATDVVQINGAGYLYGRTGSNGMNLGSSTYRWGLLYSDSINTKSIYSTGSVNGRSQYGIAVWGNVTESGTAVYGNASGTGGCGVDGRSATGGIGVRGVSSTGDAGNFQASGSGRALYAWSNTGYSAIFAKGYVGIGKTNPTTALDVTGTITATGGTSTNWNTAYGWGNHADVGYVANPMTTTGDMIYNNVLDDGVQRLPIGSDGQVLKSITTNPGGTPITLPTWSNPDWTTSGSNIYRSGGFVGVNTTNPLSRFHTVGAVRSDTALTPVVLGGSDVSSSLTLKSTSATGSSDYIAFVTGQGSERMRVTSGGNVGIGTTNPGTLFVVNGASAFIGELSISAGIKRTSTQTWDNMDYLSSTSGHLGFNAGTAKNTLSAATGAYFLALGNTFSRVSDLRGNIIFSAGNPTTPGESEGSISFITGSNVTRVRIKKDGTVGIGTTAPAAKLHVNGGIMLDGTDTTGVGSSAKVGTIQYYNGNFYGLKAGTPPTWVQLNN